MKRDIGTSLFGSPENVEAVSISDSVKVMPTYIYEYTLGK